MKFFRVFFVSALCLTIVGMSAAQLPSETLSPEFTQLAELTASDAAHLDFVGVSVAISSDGNTVAVGMGSTHTPGAVYVYTKPASGWTSMTQVAKLTASDGTANNYLGYSVAISGNAIVAGAPNSNDYSGAAYVFVKPTGGWTNMTQTAELTASGPNQGLGNSVAISGNAVVAGSPDGSNGEPGAAYVYVKPATGWKNMMQTARLTASDGLDYDGFGQTVAMSANTVVVGTLGRQIAYLFVQPMSGWANGTQTAKLTAPTTSFSVGVSGNGVVVGDPYVTVGSNQYQGAAYVFVEPAQGWKDMPSTATLTASDGASQDEFGYAVTINGNQIFVGSPFARIGSNSDQGAAYQYTKPSTGWKTTSHFNAKLVASDGAKDDELGWSLSFGGNLLLVGAPGHTSQQGAAYLFTP